MKSNTAFGTLGPNDELDCHAEALRDDIERFIFHAKYGEHGDAIPKLTDEDVNKDRAEDDDEAVITGIKPVTQRRNIRTIWGLPDSIRSQVSMDLTGMSDDEEGEIKEYEKTRTMATEAFKGKGHVMQRSSKAKDHGNLLSHLKAKEESEGVALPGFPGVRRVIQKDTTKTKPNGRVSYTDKYTPPVTLKHTTTPDLRDLHMVDDDETRGKAAKHDAGDSPGRSRSKTANTACEPGQGTDNSNSLLQSLRGDRESRLPAKKPTFDMARKR